MPDTEGLDALAALCGYTAAAAPNESSVAPNSTGTVACNLVAPAPTAPSRQQTVETAMATLFAQQHQLQQQQQQALNLQQVHNVLAIRPATATQLQQVNDLPSRVIEQVQQIERMMALQQVQQHQAVNGFGQGFQALAAQLLLQQQQQLRTNSNSLATFHGSGPSTLSQFASSLQEVSLSPAMSFSSGLQATNSDNHNMQASHSQLSSPSTLAMPPPPNQVIPNLPPSTCFPNRAVADDVALSSCTTDQSVPKQPPICEIISEWEDKKQAKRAANRLSAHLSRKRKKTFMDDLKDENAELRRKEQILRSIPDLIVVFDSSGLISFVSHSVTRFMNYTVEELEDTSFWDKLSEESVPLVKSAFMDALAVKRLPNEDCTPLVNGQPLTITLLQKNDNDENVVREGRDRHLLVSLKGVVHFRGEYPECVCSIRPEALADFNFNATATPILQSTAPSSVMPKKQSTEAGSSLFAGEAPPSHQVSDIESCSQYS